MSIELTGLSYSDWEKEAEQMQHATERSEKTGLLDALHLTHADAIADALEDEIHIVDDVRDLADPQTALELGSIRTRLAGMRDKVTTAQRRMVALIRR
jgi:hypothetical protein